MISVLPHVIISGKREAAWQCMFIHCSDVSGGMCVEE
jgi:hypothetical protein